VRDRHVSTLPQAPCVEASTVGALRAARPPRFDLAAGVLRAGLCSCRKRQSVFVPLPRPDQWVLLVQDPLDPEGHPGARPRLRWDVRQAAIPGSSARPAIHGWAFAGARQCRAKPPLSPRELGSIPGPDPLSGARTRSALQATSHGWRVLPPGPPKVRRASQGPQGFRPEGVAARDGCESAACAGCALGRPPGGPRSAGHRAPGRRAADRRGCVGGAGGLAQARSPARAAAAARNALSLATATQARAQDASSEIET